jgi:hypothetical protein
MSIQDRHVIGHLPHHLERDDSHIGADFDVIAGRATAGKDGIEGIGDRSPGIDLPLEVVAPEPGSILLLGTGLLAAAGYSLRRRK